MVASGVVRPQLLLELLDAIEPELYRFPAVEAADLRRAVEPLQPPR